MGLRSGLLACLSMPLVQRPRAGRSHKLEKPGRRLIFLPGRFVIAAAF